MAKGYLIGDAFKDKIKSTIARVDGWIDGSDVTKIETRFESMQVAPGQPVRVAAFPRTVSWSKGQAQQITFYTHTGTAFGLATTGAEGTATAVNICNDFSLMPAGDNDPKFGPTPTMTWCIISKSKGGANVAIEGPQDQPFRICTFTGAWAVGTSKTVTFKNQASPNTASATNLFFPVTSTATAIINCAIAREGTAWYLIDVPLVTATAVFVTGTAAMTFASGTETATLISGTTAGVSAAGTTTKNIITDVLLTASLNTSDCTITIGKTLTSASMTFVTGTATALHVTGTATAMVVSSTATAVFATGTVTATYLTFG